MSSSGEASERAITDAPVVAADPSTAIGRFPPVALREVDQTLPAGGGEPSLRRIGHHLAVRILVLIGTVIAGIGVFAWITYPSPESVAAIVKDSTKAFDDYQQSRALWFTEIKDLIQLLVVSLLVPLLATIIGYIFGRHEATRVYD